MSDVFSYLFDGANWSGDGGLLELMIEQLLLTITALFVACAIGLPIALWLGHLGRGGFLAINISNLGRAVPTFALLGLLVSFEWPGSAYFGPYGRAGLATLIALVAFALPPIITQAYVGVREVSPDVKEAATGVGMSGSQRFFRVELPLAMPLIASGVRVALVQIWATATIAALVNGPGLGNVIREGFANTDRRSQGYAGALLVAVLALVLELIGALIARSANPVPQGPTTKHPGALSAPTPKVQVAADNDS